MDTNHNIYFVSFAHFALKLERFAQPFFKSQSISSVAIRINSRRETVSMCLNIVFNNKTGPLFVICSPTEYLGVHKNSLKRVCAFQSELEFWSVGY